MIEIRTKDFSFRADDGKVNRLDVENTTELLEMLAALRPVADGVVAIDGEVLSPTTRSIFADRISYVPADTAIRYCTVAECLESLLVLRRPQKEEQDDELSPLTVMRKVEQDYATGDLDPDMEFAALSESHRRLLLITAVLAMERQYVLLDQPFRGLDAAQASTLALQLDAAAALGRTIII